MGKTRLLSRAGRPRRRARPHRAHGQRARSSRRTCRSGSSSTRSTSTSRHSSSGGSTRSRPRRSPISRASSPRFSAATDGATAGGDRYRMHRAVRQLLEALAATKPLVLVLDDLHWADPASLELLGSLLRRPPDAAVLLAVALRPRQLDDALRRSARARTRRGSAHAAGARGAERGRGAPAARRGRDRCRGGVALRGERGQPVLPPAARALAAEPHRASPRRRRRLDGGCRGPGAPWPPR